jgi:hypothetical protein
VVTADLPAGLEPWLVVAEPVEVLAVEGVLWLELAFEPPPQAARQSAIVAAPRGAINRRLRLITSLIIGAKPGPRTPQKTAPSTGG